MSSFQLPAPVLNFVASCVGSMDELVVLLMLMESSSRWWDARMVARELGLLASNAGHTLEQLAARNLLDIRVTDEIRYQFRPASAELSLAASEFAEAYRRHPAEVMRAILRRSADRGAHDFAEAFRIRRDDSG